MQTSRSVVAQAEGASSVSVHSVLPGSEDLAALWERVRRTDLISPASSVSHHPAWLSVVQQAFRHETCLLEARRQGSTVGLLPLAFVRSRLFGRFLVSLPYVDSAGVLAADEEAALGLVDRAVQLADQLDVRQLQLRHQSPLHHPVLNEQLAHKVHMRRPLPSSVDDLFRQLGPKVRNQVRKAEKHELTVNWGRLTLLDDFYAVFSHNMRDLGTPVFGRRLFSEILQFFGEAAELCVVRLDHKPVAAALVVHGCGSTLVPSASSLRAHNPTCANMLLYWHLLRRGVERGQQMFDFGRSTRESTTCRFKQQWGALPEPATWQSYVRIGSAGETRPESGRFDRYIQIWKRLPVSLTRAVGPMVAAGIP